MKLKNWVSARTLGLLTVTVAGCTSVDEPAVGSTQQAVSTNNFVLTRIPITYTANFGSLSGLAYDASNDTWWTHDDNRSGTVTYPTIFNFRVVGTSVEILQQLPMRDETGANVVASPSSTTQSVVTTGLDPEGIAIAPDGTFWMIDEENETFMHVSRDGQIISRHYAPGFRGSNSPDPSAGAATRVRGAGFEGIAISPDGNTIYGGHQTAQLTFPAGEADVTFIAALHVPTNTWRTYKVPLDAVASYNYPANLNPAVRMGMHDLYFDGYDAQGREQILYIERDNKRDTEARDKRIYRVTLPDYATYNNTPLAKELMVDLVANGYTREKPEGLVKRGNRYYVVNDNVQTASDPMEFTIVQRLVTPDLTCVGSAGSPALVATDPGVCTASVSSNNGKAGTCTGGGDGLASCTFDGSNPTTLALGSHEVSVLGTAVDTSTATCTSYVNVVDQQAPAITVSASPSHLWPPNHKLVPVALSINASDNCGSAPTNCTVTSNQPIDSDDWSYVNGQLQLRAGRDPGDHEGRTYTVTCTATDGAGNTKSASTTVSVAKHDPATCSEIH